MYDVGCTENSPLLRCLEILSTGPTFPKRLKQLRPDYRDAALLVATVADAPCVRPQAGTRPSGRKPANILISVTTVSPTSSISGWHSKKNIRKDQGSPGRPPTQAPNKRVARVIGLMVAATFSASGVVPLQNYWRAASRSRAISREELLSRGR